MVMTRLAHWPGPSLLMREIWVKVELQPGVFRNARMTVMQLKNEIIEMQCHQWQCLMMTFFTKSGGK
jgi:hypothetical protein